VQTTADAADAEVEVIRQAAEEAGGTMQDKRDQRTSGTYFAFVSCVYAFLGILTLVTVLNMVNSISMSVSARVKEYGAMRAVGMDEHQMAKMILAEAGTYAVWGCVAGCAFGLLFHKLLYELLIVDRFPFAAWHVPGGALAVVGLFVAAATALAVWVPVKRLRMVSVTETLQAL
ncbi:MAG: ABC transporter permease, partial [Clostridiales bacterium]|nr:ABC transporter permease [Clostridiales bacterium]